MSESSLIKFQVLKTATLSKRDSNTDFLLLILWIIQEHLFCRWYMKGWFWNTSVPLFKNTFFYRTSPVAASDSSRFPPTALLKKRLGERCLSVNFVKFLWTSFVRRPPDDCFLCLSVSFEKFFRSPLLQSTSGKLLVSFTSCRISITTYSKQVFHMCFSSIL